MKSPTAARVNKVIVGALLAAPLILLLAFLLFWPLALILRQSVAVGETSSGFTFQNLTDVFSVPRYRRALSFSLLISFSVASVSTLVCLAPAWVFAHEKIPFKRLLRTVIALPMSFAGVIVAFLMIVMFGRSGFVPQLFEGLTGTPWFGGDAYKISGLIAAYMYFEIPRATLTLESALQKFDTGLLAAARSLGAGRWQCLRRIVLPAIWPSLLSTFAVTFSVSLGSFGVALILAPRGLSVLPLEIFTQYVAPPSDFTVAAAMALILAVIAIGVNFGARFVAGRRERLFG